MRVRNIGDGCAVGCARAAFLSVSRPLRAQRADCCSEGMRLAVSTLYYADRVPSCIGYGHARGWPYRPAVSCASRREAAASACRTNNIARVAGGIALQAVARRASSTVPERYPYAPPLAGDAAVIGWRAVILATASISSRSRPCRARAFEGWRSRARRPARPRRRRTNDRRSYELTIDAMSRVIRSSFSSKVIRIRRSLGAH